ncbi:MAG: hypothetical protein WBP13_09815 [Methylophilaceae bacterium]
MDAPAEQRIDAGLKSALTSFATARLLNAVISVAQGTEVALEPMGVGVSLAPGQLLDPINDLVEQFSDLMLVATVAFGIQKILINIGGYWLVNVLLTLSALGWAYLCYRLQPIPIWLSKCLVVLLMTRFAIPIVVIGTDVIFQKFMADKYAASQQVIASAPKQITAFEAEAPNSQPATKGEGLSGWLEEKMDHTKSMLDFKNPLKRLQEKAGNLQKHAEFWVEHIIDLIVIFLLQTLILPLLLVWMFYAVLRRAFELPRRQ